MADSLRINDLLANALRASAMRQNVIANNVANVETPGFRAKRVVFEELLRDALDTGDTGRARDVDFELLESKSPGDPLNKNNVSLEEEVGALVANTMRYKTYMRILGKRFKQLDLAIRGSY